MGTPHSSCVLILTGDTGEGHHAAARAIARDLKRNHPTVAVQIRDGLKDMGLIVNALVRGGCLMQLQSSATNAAYGLLYEGLRRNRPLRSLAYSIAHTTGVEPLKRVITASGADLVVSTHPVVSVGLGYLRRHGRLSIPTATVLLDLGGLLFWVQPGVDLNVVMHRNIVQEVQRLAPGTRCREARPIVDPVFYTPLDVNSARSAIGVNGDSPMVLVSGGGWGAGDLSGAIETALAETSATVICVAGRNERVRGGLRRAFRGRPRVRILGFTMHMHKLMAAADVIVHSTGGITCLEALVRGCPLITYGSPPGHAREYCQALAAAGLSRHASSKADLALALQETLTLPRPATPLFEDLPTPGQIIGELLCGQQAFTPVPISGERRPSAHCEEGLEAVS